MPRSIAHIKDKRSIKKRQNDFLDKFELYCSVMRAAKAAKVPRRTIYQWIEDDKQGFKVEFEKSRKIAIAALEDEAARRAYEGVDRPVFQGGKKVGKIREYSDTLLIVLLKGHYPERYKERVQNEHSGKDGGPIQTVSTITHNLVVKRCDK